MLKKLKIYIYLIRDKVLTSKSFNTSIFPEILKDRKVLVELIKHLNMNQQLVTQIAEIDSL